MKLNATILAFGLAAILAGCGGTGIQAPSTVTQSSATDVRHDRAGSWMLPEAKGEDLLYASDLSSSNSGEVRVYDFATQQQVGSLTGFGQATGLCTDNAGNVYVTDFKNSQIVEYAHAGKKPLRTIQDKGYPDSCSIDSRNGDLAVANVSRPSSNYGGDVAIYRGGAAIETISSKKVQYMQACAYGAGGNLFIDGANTSRYGTTNIYGVAYNRRTKLNTFHLGIPDDTWDLKWDGKYMTFWDDGTIYQYAMDRKSRTQEGKIYEGGPEGFVYEYWFAPKYASVVAIDSGHDSVDYFYYPEYAGKPYAVIQLGEEAYGVTVSLASSH